MKNKIDEKMLTEMLNENFIEVSAEEQEKVNGGVMLLYAIQPGRKIMQKIIKEIIKHKKK